MMAGSYTDVSISTALHTPVAVATVIEPVTALNVMQPEAPCVAGRYQHVPSTYLSVPTQGAGHSIVASCCSCTSFSRLPRPSTHTYTHQTLVDKSCLGRLIELNELITR